VGETHHVKPRNPWAADADEGYALAQSAIRLPGEHYPSQGAERAEGRARQTGRSRSRTASVSTSSNSSSNSRPPSLERQDAFREEKTVKAKRRRGRGRPSTTASAATWTEDEQHSPVHLGAGDLDASETAELYRMGLLYDDEHERGAGFSLDAIARDPEAPVYSLRVRPARGSRSDERDDRGGRGGNAALSVDLAFSAFGEDEALAGWLLSASSSQGTLLEESRPWTEAVDGSQNPRLTVIYELADDISAVSGDDFLDSVSVSEISYCGEDDERVWALSECNAAPGTAASVVEVEEGDVGPWVVLGHDGS
jgi:hypothetical protein